MSILHKKNDHLKRQIRRILPVPMLRAFQKIMQKRTKGTLVQNINIKPYLEQQKRVLISYITDSLLTSSSEWDKNTRPKECSLIIGAFLDKGFTIDVIGCNDQSNLQSILPNHYDVIFGFGTVFYEMCKRQPNAKRILYLTEKHPDFSFMKEKERIDYFYKRHNRKITFERSGLYYKNEHFDVADLIIYVGNESDKQLLPVKVPCLPINVTGLSNAQFNIKNRNVSEAKNHFLWLGSRGAIHKGLDILIDVFDKQEESVLHIAGLNSVDKKTLQAYSNTSCIRDHGFLPVKSAEFCSLMEQCGFLIFPSCSEGQSTAVITGMNSGLIPLITPEAGFNLPNIGAYIFDYSVESIAELVKTYANKSDEWVTDQQARTFEYSTENFNIYRYESRLKEILKDFCI